jgi:MFS family permease
VTPIYSASVPGIIQDFQISAMLAVAPLSLYAAGLGIGALMSSAFSEVLGRSIVYRVAVPLTLAFAIVRGSAKELQVSAVARTLAAFFASPCLTIGAGVFNDNWDVKNEKIGTLIAVLYVLTVIWSTQIGYMMGAGIVLDRNDDWRWTFWLIAVFLGVLTVLVFLVPETYKPEILRRRAQKNGAACTIKRRIHCCLPCFHRTSISYDHHRANRFPNIISGCNLSISAILLLRCLRSGFRNYLQLHALPGRHDLCTFSGWRCSLLYPLWLSLIRRRGDLSTGPCSGDASRHDCCTGEATLSLNIASYFASIFSLLVSLRGLPTPTFTGSHQFYQDFCSGNHMS